MTMVVYRANVPKDNDDSVEDLHLPFWEIAKKDSRGNDSEKLLSKLQGLRILGESGKFYWVEPSEDWEDEDSSDILPSTVITIFRFRGTIFFTQEVKKEKGYIVSAVVSFREQLILPSR